MSRVGKRTSPRPRRAPTPITCVPSKTWKMAAISKSSTARVATGATGVNRAQIARPCQANSTAQLVITARPANSAPTPIACRASVSFPPRLADPHAHRMRQTEREHERERGAAERNLMGCERDRAEPPIINAAALNAPTSNNSMTPVGTPKRKSSVMRARCQGRRSAARKGAKGLPKRSQAATARAATVRAMSVDQPEPIRPSSGKPQCPKTAASSRTH